MYCIGECCGRCSRSASTPCLHHSSTVGGRCCLMMLILLSVIIAFFTIISTALKDAILYVESDFNDDEIKSHSVKMTISLSSLKFEHFVKLSPHVTSKSGFELNSGYFQRNGDAELLLPDLKVVKNRNSNVNSIVFESNTSTTGWAFYSNQPDKDLACFCSAELRDILFNNVDSFLSDMKRTQNEELLLSNCQFQFTYLASKIDYELSVMGTTREDIDFWRRVYYKMLLPLLSREKMKFMTKQQIFDDGEICKLVFACLFLPYVCYLGYAFHKTESGFRHFQKVPSVCLFIFAGVFIGIFIGECIVLSELKGIADEPPPSSSSNNQTHQAFVQHQEAASFFPAKNYQFQFSYPGYANPIKGTQNFKGFWATDSIFSVIAVINSLLFILLLAGWTVYVLGRQAQERKMMISMYGGGVGSAARMKSEWEESLVAAGVKKMGDDHEAKKEEERKRNEAYVEEVRRKLYAKKKMEEEKRRVGTHDDGVIGLKIPEFEAHTRASAFDLNRYDHKAELPNNHDRDLILSAMGIHNNNKEKKNKNKKQKNQGDPDSLEIDDSVVVMAGAVPFGSPRNDNEDL